MNGGIFRASGRSKGVDLVVSCAIHETCGI